MNKLIKIGLSTTFNLQDLYTLLELIYLPTNPTKKQSRQKIYTYCFGFTISNVTKNFIY